MGRRPRPSGRPHPTEPGAGQGAADRAGALRPGDGPDPRPPARTAARLLLVATVVIAAGGAITTRVIIAGEQEIAASTAALKAGDAWEATVRARRAASWYAPGAPHVSVAYERLIALARTAEERKQPDIALFAWRSVRTAALETRWVTAPHAAQLELANREIARLMSQSDPKPDDQETLTAEHLKLLSADEAPRLGWSVTLVLAFVIWALGIGLWSRRIAGPGGRTEWSQARLPAVLTAVGIALWLLAVWRA